MNLDTNSTEQSYHSDFWNFSGFSISEETKKSPLFLLANDIDKYCYGYIFPIVLGVWSLWNLLIIIYFVKINLKNLTRMSSYHFLIINLAAADLCTYVGISNIFPLMRKLGAFGCVFLTHFFEAVCPVVSCWLFVLISFTRYRSIVHPLRTKINKKVHCLACFSIWLIASLLNIYHFLTRIRKLK